MKFLAVLLICALAVVAIHFVTTNVDLPQVACSLPLIKTNLPMCIQRHGLPVPIPQGAPVAFTSNVSIRVDSVQMLNSDNDLGLGGEAAFVLLAIRTGGALPGSRRLVAPGSGAYSIQVGDAIDLSDFSLQVNHVGEREQVRLFLVGLESDHLGEERDALNFALDFLSDSLIEMVLPVDQSLYQVGLRALTGSAETWWRDQETLGEAEITLNKANNWGAGKRFSVQSTNKNLNWTLTILHSSEKVDSKTEMAQLVVTNQSTELVRAVYVWPSHGDAWRSKLSTDIAPGASEKFLVEPGTYDLRAEGEKGMRWEKPAVQLTTSQEWKIY